MNTTTDMPLDTIDDAHGDAIDMECERAHDAFMNVGVDADDATFLAARAEAERADRQQLRAFRMWVNQDYVGRDYDEAIIEDSARRVADLLSGEVEPEYFDDGMIELFISGATEPCPQCGELVLKGCGRHLATKHAGAVAAT
jgi:hypothetical protein